MPLRTAVLVVGLAGALVVGTATPGSPDDATVTWDQVRALLGADGRHGHAPHPPPPDGPTTPPTAPGTASVLVTIPDLSWAVDDPTAPAGTRRAACHQVLGMDDETAAPLAACLRHVRPPSHPQRWEHDLFQPGQPFRGHGGGVGPQVGPHPPGR